MKIAESPSTKPFNYENPDYEWPRDFASCGGRRQSPINIVANNVRSRTANDYFRMEGYDIESKLVYITNNGHTGNGRKIHEKACLYLIFALGKISFVSML